MMDCLHCGDCCKRFSPISDGPCSYIVEQGTFVFCSVYDYKPDRCTRHDFPESRCPIGIWVLGINSLDELRQRIDDGWDMAKALKTTQRIKQ